MTQSQAIAIRELQETNASLTTLVQDLTSQISSLTAATRQNQQEAGQRSGGRYGRRRPFTQYCWTHGYNQSHGSSICTRPATGHCRQATHQNRMGGSEKNQHRYTADS